VVKRDFCLVDEERSGADHTLRYQLWRRCRG
jgi:hypothetical protein